MRKKRILVVDDEKNIRDSIVRFLSLEDIDAVPAENGNSARRLLEEEYFDGAVIDLRMPGMDGLELLTWINEEGRRVPAIMISAFGEISDAVEAMKAGARDYIVKPFDPEELVIRLKRIIEEEQRHATIEAGMKYADEGTLVPDDEGTGKKSRELERIVRKVAATDSTVLVTGESGTGKEVTARRIHALSDRAGNPFVPINIGGIPETLLESELFGHEKGAFTGAHEKKRGMVEVAASGTLFLDETGDMPLHLQVKMLRFLQEKRIQRVGGTVSFPVDVRIIAATNRDLKTLIAENRFREDLYFRLAVITIDLMPLRERKEELPLLIGFFIERFNRQMRGPRNRIQGISDEALSLLSGYNFPGNIRELANMIERAIILAEGDRLMPEDFDIPRDMEEEKKLVKPGKLRDIERETILSALSRWEGNRTRAAEELGITRRTLFNKLKEYGIETDG